ncbi:MAG: serpin family protein [Verrucomicrobiota bacterium]
MPNSLPATFPALLILLVILSGCTHISQAGKDDSSEAASPSATDTDPASSNNAFAMKLYQKLIETEDDNIFFSPYSISTALTMTWAGADGETADEMGDVLHFPSDNRSAVHSDYREMLEQMRKREKAANYELVIANALWGQEDSEFREDFLELVTDYYDAVFREVNYKSEAEEAREKINQWVAEKTRDKIKDLIPSGVLDKMTRLVLTNAVYFKAPWSKQFSEKKTREETFTCRNGQEVEMPMMHKSDSFMYAETDDCKLLEMTYENNDFSMVIILPHQPDGLSALEEEITLPKLRNMLDKLQQTRVEAGVPRFKITSRFQLSEMLRDLGMRQAFNPQQADFSRINNNQEKLFLKEVLHKSYIDVYEKGTEAAAATGVVMQTTALPPESEKEFNADHPFLFLIRDLHTDNIIFIGRVVSLEEDD